MATKLNYTPEEILNIKFSPAEKGYDPLEVDQIFDKIIKDYETAAKNLEKAIVNKEKHDAEIASLKEELNRAEYQIAALNKKIAILQKASGLTDDNYKLLRKVNAYEKALWKKGIDPQKVLSDPDNC